MRLDFQLLLGSRPGPTGEKRSGVGRAVPLAFSHYPLVQPRVQMGRKGNMSSPMAARELTSSGGVWELSHHRPRKVCNHHHQEGVAFDNVTSQQCLSTWLCLGMDLE